MFCYQSVQQGEWIGWICLRRLSMQAQENLFGLASVRSCQIQHEHNASDQPLAQTVRIRPPQKTKLGFCFIKWRCSAAAQALVSHVPQ